MSDSLHSDDSADAVLKTPFGNAHEISVSRFTQFVLPPLHPDIDIEARLSKRALRRVVTKEGKWWGYGNTKPGLHRSRGFSKCYAWLQRGVRRAVNAIRKVKPALEFRVNKEGEPVFDRRTEGSPPDAFFLTASSMQHSFTWEHVAVIGELDSYDLPSDSEATYKMVDSMSRCMRADPCRRFIYGFTIENAKTRLWYGDRSLILVSEAFSFIENYRAFLSFALRVSFAQPHQLGWDPTMRRIEWNGQTQYELQVHPSDGAPETYRTLAVLFDSRAYQLLSRGTRVWKVVRLVNGEEVGPPTALKDAWVDNNREREGDIHWRLFNSEYFAQEHPELKDCFVTVQTHGDVMGMGPLDRTPCFLDRDPSPLEMDNAPAPISKSRTHYRIVYAELGEPLRDITSLHTVFHALVDALKGISAMHAAGWVHRDLSAGNILLVNGRGKVHDLELATDDTDPDKVGRSGTADFVAVEVDEQKYLFQQLPPFERTPTPPETLAWRALSPSRRHSVSPPPRPRPRPRPPLPEMPEFRYNPLHDLESLWWNAVYLTLNREIDDSADGSLSTTPHQRLAQRHSAEKLFHQRMERYCAIALHIDFAHHFASLHPVMSGIGEIIEEVRLSLQCAYTEAEKSIAELDTKIPSELADHMRVEFNNAAVILQERNVVVRKFMYLRTSTQVGE